MGSQFLYFCPFCPSDDLFSSNIYACNYFTKLAAFQKLVLVRPCLFGRLYFLYLNVLSVIFVELTSHICISYQMEIKPNPHPERPNRLRAIAASLAAAGAHYRLV